MRRITRQFEFQFGVAVGALAALILFCAPIALVLALGAHPHHPVAQAPG